MAAHSRRKPRMPKTTPRNLALTKSMLSTSSATRQALADSNGRLFAFSHPDTRKCSAPRMTVVPLVTRPVRAWRVFCVLCMSFQCLTACLCNLELKVSMQFIYALSSNVSSSHRPAAECRLTLGIGLCSCDTSAMHVVIISVRSTLWSHNFVRLFVKKSHEHQARQICKWYDSQMMARYHVLCMHWPSTQADGWTFARSITCYQDTDAQSQASIVHNKETLISTTYLVMNCAAGSILLLGTWHCLPPHVCYH